jgi:hypothetical protein
LPDEVIYKAQDKMLKFMTDGDDTLLISSYLGYERLLGTVFLNPKPGKIGFRDIDINIFRTALKMELEDIQQVIDDSFHLFPNAGRPRSNLGI